jgi:hypothetical protein
MHTTTILATGLMQGRISNGMAAARLAILKKSATADVNVYSWREWEKIEELANGINVNWETGQNRIVLAGHSWGVWWCVKLAQELNDKQIPVEVLLSADGVNKPPNEALEIPTNVGEVWSWYQTNGAIHGSPLRIDPPTVLACRKEADVRHQFVDENKEFQRMVLQFATKRA